MNIVVDGNSMKSLDDYTINQIGIPSMVLMERAALAVANCVKDNVNKGVRILAVSGTGNNGADAIAAARILSLWGYDTDIMIVGDINKCSEEFTKQINIAKNLGISLYNNVDINEYTIIIDGMFGIGLNQPVQGKYLDYIQLINKGDNTVFCVDIPSGLSANYGNPLGDVVKADYTVTFGYNKIGLIMYPGCEYAGQVIVADIGFPQINSQDLDTRYYVYDECDLSKLPKRKNDSHKGDYGKVLVIAGAAGMNGACYLASKGAYRTGAGLVKAVVPEENRTSMQTMLPEVILSTYKRGKELQIPDMNQISNDISWASVIAIGPGLGKDKISQKLLELVLDTAKVPLVIDADGINLLSKMIDDTLGSEKDKNIKKRIDVLKEILPKNTILTPHLKELSRLLNIELDEIKKNLLEVSNTCTKDNDIIFVIKDARTIVAFESKRFINTTGNSGMSTGGSGDVLTGIIVSLIGQGLKPREGAALGVYIHGLAGDFAANEKNRYSLIASDIIDGLAKI